MRFAEQTLEQVRADRDYWRELCRLVGGGWELSGWSYREGATIITRRGPPRMLELTGEERDAIVGAIQRGGKEA